MSSEGLIQRDTGIDLCRIVACFTLLPFHYATYGQVGAPADVIYSGVIIKSLFGFHVPLFIMISGALFLKRDMLDIKRLYSHNILKLVCVYVFWSAVYAVFDVILNWRNITDIKSLVVWIIMDIRDSHYHLWYLPMLIGIYILIPIVHSAFGGGRNSNTLKYAVLIVFGVFGVIIHTLLLIPIRADSYEMLLTKIDVGIFAGWMGFFLTGYYLYTRRYDIKSKTMKNCIIASVISLFVILAVNLIMSDTKDMDCYLGYFTVPCAIVECTIFLVFVRIKNEDVSKRELIAKVADSMLGVYCMHDLVMSLVHMVFEFIPDSMFVLRVVIVVTVSFVVSTILVMWLRKSAIMKRIAV